MGLRAKLSPYKDVNGGRFHFDLYFRDARFLFSLDPGDLDYGDYLSDERGQIKKGQTETAEILSKIAHLYVDAKTFSTSILRKVFPWVKLLVLPDTECISGLSEKADFAVCQEDFDKAKKICDKPCPLLEAVYTPKVTEIANAAFFNFGNLKWFNGYPVRDEEYPAIVGAMLDPGYFEQDKISKSMRISPIEVEIERCSGGKNKGKVKKSRCCDGKPVGIGACAFARCRSLQHISARASFVGSAAFARSGLKSAHLLLSEDAVVGDNVFFNCFLLKECFMLLGRTSCGGVNSALNGLFWNCFNLKTVCMPNIRSRSPQQQEYKKREAYASRVAYNDENLVFANCTALENLDLRHLAEEDFRCLVFDSLIRSNHKLIEDGGQEWERYRSSGLASVPGGSMSFDVPEEAVTEDMKLCFAEEASEPIETVWSQRRNNDESIGVISVQSRAGGRFQCQQLRAKI